MKNIKVNIFFSLSEMSGGGNQFLKALKNQLQLMDVYSENPEEADVVLFNSHQEVKQLIRLKQKYPNKVYVHRIDGPMQMYNSRHDKRDIIVYTANSMLADATVFQSNWSKDMNLKRGIRHKEKEVVISNASDPNIFYKKEANLAKSTKKNKIIAVSWSSNLNKGFNDYKYLDENLDFSKYEFTFVGNSPYEFKNIKHIQAQKSESLAEILRNHDIYITTSRKEPCSNSLIEALSCGLPCIGLKDGGTPELIGMGGLLYEKVEEIPGLIDKILQDYKVYQECVSVKSIHDVSQKYYEFMFDVYRCYNEGNLAYNKFAVSRLLIIKLKIGYVKIYAIFYNRLKSAKNKVFGKSTKK